jgi:hypothetical protein
VSLETLLMKLVCPSCGAIASANSWMNDELCRETLAKIAALPSPLPKASLGYLGLFRPGQNGLTWKKALRLAEEIAAIASKGFVHVQGKIDHNCPPRIWAQAMEQMVERRNSLSLPLPNGHVYLCKVAWDLANQEDAANERSADQNARNNRRSIEGSQPVASIQNPLYDYAQGLRDTKPTDEEMDEWRRGRML